MWLWGLITSCVNLQLRWGFKKSYSPRQKICKGMWHSTWKQVNQSDSQLLLVRCQIGNLTPNPYFGHNLCFKYPNAEPIPNISISKNLQWYNEKFQSNEFWPLKSPSKNSKIRQDSNFESGSSFGNVGVHSFTFSYTLKSMKCDSHASLLARIFASLCFDHNPKARVAIMYMLTVYIIHVECDDIMLNYHND
jgi:hypothetical protein